MKAWISNPVAEFRKPGGKDRASCWCLSPGTGYSQNLSFRICFWFFWWHCAACRILVPGPVTELRSQQWKQPLDHQRIPGDPFFFLSPAKPTRPSPMDTTTTLPTPRGLPSSSGAPSPPSACFAADS